MALKITIFYVVLIAALGYVLRRGGAPERIVAALFVVAAVATSIVPFDYKSTFHILNWGVLAVDLTLFACLLLVALRANRFWPIWLAAFQLVELGIHGVRAYDANLWAIVYGRAIGLIAYPMMLLLVIGTNRHRQRVMMSGAESAWSPIVRVR